jgi:uncharacterized membrane protein (UPF0182 family)
MPWKIIGVAAAVIVALLIALGRASGLVVDWAWFSSVGYAGVFWTVFVSRLMIFAAVFIASAALLWVNGALALRFASRRRSRLPAVFDIDFSAGRAPSGAPTQPLRLSTTLLPWRLIIIAASLVIGLLVAIGEAENWGLLLRFLYQSPYGQSDPLFDKDISFYLFSLPVYVALKNWLMWLLFLSALIAGAVYFAHGQINLDRRPWVVSPAAVAHGSALLGL